MAKYGLTLRTTSLNGAFITHHNIIVCGPIFYTLAEAQREMLKKVQNISAMLGRNATEVHTGGSYPRAAWHVQNGQPGDDLSIFVDHYEDEQ